MDFFSFRENLNEAAVSKQQQKLFALALAYRKGEVPEDEVSDTVKKLAKDVSMKELEKFASTSHKGLPDKVEEKFVVGQNVEFTGKRGQTVRGTIQKINSKTVIVKTHFMKKGRDHSNTHRVPRSILRKSLIDKVDEKMDPTKHVNKDGDEYVVVDKNGEEVKRFKDKDTADKYATDNHDALMESASKNPGGAKAQKIANTLNRKIASVKKLRSTGKLYRVRYDPDHDDFLSTRGRKMIDDIDRLFDDLQSLDHKGYGMSPASKWYFDTYHNGNVFDAEDLSA